LRNNADAICEKPIVLNHWNIDALQAIEKDTGKKVHTVLQLRLHPAIIALKKEVEESTADKKFDIDLTYITSRGKWYFTSWKGDEKKSGGVATNIGVHFFDLLIWLFGPVTGVKVYHSDDMRMSGFIELERARVRWFLSVDKGDLPISVKANNKTTYRSITVDGKEIEFSEGFTDLHTRVYEETLAGHGFGIADARPSIDLTYAIRTAAISPKDDLIHPLLRM